MISCNKFICYRNIIKKIDNFSVHVSSTVLKYDLDNQSDLTFQCNKSLEDFISGKFVRITRLKLGKVTKLILQPLKWL